MGQRGLAVGDLVLILHQEEARGAGRITQAEDERSRSWRAELDWLDWGLEERGWALVIPQDLPTRLRPHLPPFVTCNSTSDSRVSGLRPDQGDDEREFPSQRFRTRVVRLRSAAGGEGNGIRRRRTASWVQLDARGRVADVSRGPMPPTTRPASPEMPRVGIGDRFDLHRGAAYVGFAKVTSVEPGLVWAETLASLCARPVEVGDLAVRRLAPGPEIDPCGYVFRQEPGYVLVSLGEADGVRRGDRLFSRSADGGEYRLVVDRSYPDHCGAAVERDRAQPTGQPTVWDPVRRACAPRLVVPVLSAAGGPQANWRVILDTPGEREARRRRGGPTPQVKRRLVAVERAALPERIREGDFVFPGNRLDGFGVVLIAEVKRAYLYVPGVWSVFAQERHPDGPKPAGFQAPPPAAD